MARIAVMNDFPEVIVGLARLITPGHHVDLINFPYEVEKLRQSPPDAVVAVLFRKDEALDRPIENFYQDVVGSELVATLDDLPELRGHPLILFGVGVRPQDIPDEVHYHTFITFPQAIQELNPLISGLVGVAPQT